MRKGIPKEVFIGHPAKNSRIPDSVGRYAQEIYVEYSHVLLDTVKCSITISYHGSTTAKMGYKTNTACGQDEIRASSAVKDTGIIHHMQMPKRELKVGLLNCLNTCNNEICYMHFSFVSRYTHHRFVASCMGSAPSRRNRVFTHYPHD